MDFILSRAWQSADLPPRTGFAERGHPQLLQELPDIQLTLLIGQYAPGLPFPGEKSQWQGNRTDQTKQNYLQPIFHSFNSHREIKSGWPKILGLSQKQPDLKKN